LNQKKGCSTHPRGGTFIVTVKKNIKTSGASGRRDKKKNKKKGFVYVSQMETFDLHKERGGLAKRKKEHHKRSTAGGHLSRKKGLNQEGGGQAPVNEGKEVLHITEILQGETTHDSKKRFQTRSDRPSIEKKKEKGVRC